MLPRGVRRLSLVVLLMTLLSLLPAVPAGARPAPPAPFQPAAALPPTGNPPRPSGTGSGSTSAGDVDPIVEVLEPDHTVTGVFNGEFGGSPSRVTAELAATLQLTNGQAQIFPLPPGPHHEVRFGWDGHTYTHNGVNVGGGALDASWRVAGTTTWSSLGSNGGEQDYDTLAISLGNVPITQSLELRLRCSGYYYLNASNLCDARDVRVLEAVPGWYPTRLSPAGWSNYRVATTCASSMNQDELTSQGQRIRPPLAPLAADGAHGQFLCVEQIGQTGSANIRSSWAQLPTFASTDTVTVSARLAVSTDRPLYPYDYGELAFAYGSGFRTLVTTPLTATTWTTYTSAKLPTTMSGQWGKFEAIEKSLGSNYSEGHVLLGVDQIEVYKNGKRVGIPVDQSASKCLCDISGVIHRIIGDPVNTQSGALIELASDLSLPAAGPALLLARGYVSQLATSSLPQTALGPGWRHTFDEALTLPGSGTGAEDHTVIYESATGNRYRFFESQPGVYAPASGINAMLAATILTGTTPLTYTLTTAANRVLVFNTTGQLVEQRDAQGRVQTLTRGIPPGLSTSQVLTVTDTLTGRGLFFSYASTANGPRLTQLADSASRAVSYTYTSAGDLATVTDVMNGVTTYGYSGHRLTSTQRPGFSQPAITTQFDGQGRVSQQTDLSGVTTDYTYGTTDPLGGTTTTITVTGGTQPSQVIKDHYRADSTLRMIEQDGQLRQYFTWDASFKPTNVLDGNGTTQQIRYGPNGLPIQMGSVAILGAATDIPTTTITYTPERLPAEVVSANGTVRYTYDAQQQPTQIVQVAPTGQALTTTLTYTADAFHRLASQTSPQGITTAYAYDSLGQTTQVVQRAGTTAALITTYGYDGAGRVITTTVGSGTPEATTTRTVYRADGQVERTYRNWTWTGSGDPTPGQTENVLDAIYGYDAAGRPIWTQRADGIYPSYTHYDGAGRVDWTVQHPVDNQGDPVIPTSMPAFDPSMPDANIVTMYGFDDLNRVSLVTQTGILSGAFTPATEQWSAATQRVTKVEYDALSRPVTRTLNYQPTLTGVDMNVATYTFYDGASNIIWQSDAAGYWTHTAYDGLNRPVTTTANYENGDPLTVDPANVGWTDGTDTDLVTVTAYGPDGQVARTIANYADGVWTATEPLTDRITLPVYDAFGRVITQTLNYAPGVTSTDTNLTSVTRYDALTGQVQATQDALGQWTVPQYDSIGRTTHTLLNCRDLFGNPAWTGCVTPGGRTDRSVPTNQPASGYDGLGRATLQTDVLGRVTRTQYDGLGRVTATTQNYVQGAPTTALTNVTTLTSYHDALGTIITTTDPLSATTSRETIGLGLGTVMTDTQGLVTRSGARWSRTPDGVYTVQQIDGLGRTVATIANYQDGVHALYEAPDQDVISTIEYDAAGRQAATTTPGGRRTEYRYDGRGLLTAVQENVLTSGCTLGRTDCNVLTTYTYDRAGQRIAITDANGHTRTVTYDALGRQIATTDALAATTGYRYDVASRLVTMDDPRGSSYDVTQTYDELGRVVATTSGSGTTLTPITRTYDLASRPLQMTDGSGTTAYAYDPLGRVQAVTTALGTVGYAYNARGQRTALAYPGGTTVGYSYLSGGPLDTVTQGGTTLADYAYDPQTGRLSGVTQPHGMATSYGYDDLGRLTGLVRSQSGTPLQSFASAFSMGGPITQTVETVQGTTTVTDYTYDGLERLTGSSATGQVEGYSYDAVGNRLTATLNGATTQSYTYNAANEVTTSGWSYDAAGNLLSDGTQSYTWDALGWLATATPAGQSAIAYTYDGDGLLTAATQSSATTAYVQDTQAGLSQVLATTTGGTTMEFLYGVERLASLTGGAYRWEFHDRQGSVRLELDSAGSVIQTPRYDAWGRVLSGTPSPFGYTGELQSAATGLQYLRARWYNPATGTLLGRDPFAGYATAPYSLHPYQYGYSQPTLYSDPSGYRAQFGDEPEKYLPNQQGSTEGPKDGNIIDDEIDYLCSLTLDGSSKYKTIIKYTKISIQDQESAYKVARSIETLLTGAGNSMITVTKQSTSSIGGSIEVGGKISPGSGSPLNPVDLNGKGIFSVNKSSVSTIAQVQPVVEAHLTSAVSSRFQGAALRLPEIGIGAGGVNRINFYMIEYFFYRASGWYHHRLDEAKGLRVGYEECDTGPVCGSSSTITGLLIPNGNDWVVGPSVDFTLQSDPENIFVTNSQMNAIKAFFDVSLTDAGNGLKTQRTVILQNY